MLYIIGLGLNEEGISKMGLEIVRRCKRVYLEKYTVDFPYNNQQLEESIGKKIIPVDREKVESLEIVDEAKKMEVALLVYGSPLTATTHISLIQEAKRLRIKSKVIYAGSIMDAVAETGLQLYKFGKTASMPKWDSSKGFTPDSFMKIVQENLSMKAHSLILVDIGLRLSDALTQLEKAADAHKIKLNKIVLGSKLGTNKKKIVYESIHSLKDTTIQNPFCIIIPSKLHFVEKEVLEEFEEKE